MVLAVRRINKILKGQWLELEKPKKTLWIDQAVSLICSVTFYRKRSAQHPWWDSRTQSCNPTRQACHVPQRIAAGFSAALGTPPAAKFKRGVSQFLQAPFPLQTHLLPHVVSNSAFHRKNNLPERSTVTFEISRPMKCQDCNTRWSG